jgi:hypothetical protein
VQGIGANSAKPFIANNEFLDVFQAIYLRDSDSVVVGNSIEVANHPTSPTSVEYGVSMYYHDRSVVSGNVIKADAALTETDYCAVRLETNQSGYYPRFANNVMLGNGIGTGVKIVNAGNYPILINNSITGHAVDIDATYSAPRIMFNVFDTITGTGGQGEYNTTSAGAIIAVP